MDKLKSLVKVFEYIALLAVLIAAIYPFTLRFDSRPTIEFSGDEVKTLVRNSGWKIADLQASISVSQGKSLDEIRSLLLNPSFDLVNLIKVCWDEQPHQTFIYHLVSNVVVKIFEFKEPWQQRWISAFFGAIYCLVISLVAMDLSGLKKAALIAFSIASTNPLAFTISRENRHYSLYVLFSLIVVYSFLKLLKSPSWSWAIVHSSALILAFYTWPMGIMLIPAEVLVLIVLLFSYSTGRELRLPILSIFFSLWLIIPWIVRIAMKNQTVRNNTLWLVRYSKAPSLESLFPVPLLTFWPIIVVAIVILSVIVVSLFFVRYPNTDRGRQALVLLAFFVVPILVMLGHDWFRSANSIAVRRYLSTVLPPLQVGLAIGFAGLISTRKRAIKICALVLFLVVITSALYQTISISKRKFTLSNILEPTKNLCGLIETHRPSALVVRNTYRLTYKIVPAALYCSKDLLDTRVSFTDKNCSKKILEWHGVTLCR